MTKILHAEHTPRSSALDAQRGLAILLVLFVHLLGKSQTGQANSIVALFTVVDLGHLGVCLFFIISGYIIPQSLDRLTLPVFWWRRFFRLYPCYWLSIALVIAVTFTGQARPYTEQFETMPVWLTLVNLTMLQPLFGGDHLLGVYWTLFYELVFYALMSLLVMLGLEKRSMWIALVVWVVAVIHDVIVARSDEQVTLVISLFGLMAIGHVLYRVAEQRLRQRWVYLLIGLYCLLFALLPTPPAITLARCGSIMVFLFLMHVQWQPRLMAWIGLISYPLYLTHELVIAMIETENTGLNLLLWFGGSILFAWMIHWRFEQPILRMGRRLIVGGKV